MNFVKSEDSAKLAKLGGAIFVVFGCAAWRVAGAASGTSAPPVPEVVSTSTPTADSAAAGPSATSSDEGIVVPKMIVASTDPFRTLFFAKPGVVPSGPLPGPVGPLPVLPLPGPGPVTPSSLPPAQVAPPRAPIRISGILAGANATAVLEIGTESIVAHEGARLADGTIVVHIAPASVTIQRDGETKVLDIEE